MKKRSKKDIENEEILKLCVNCGNERAKEIMVINGMAKSEKDAQKKIDIWEGKRKKSMRYLLPKAEDPDCYYSQENNPTEEMDRKRGYEHYLQTCGPTAAVSLLVAMGVNVDMNPVGNYKPQPEEVLTDYFNDPANYEKLTAIRASTPADSWVGNEIPQFYKVAIPDMFPGVKVKFIWWDLDFLDIVANIKFGSGIMACMETPGHFIAITGCNTESGSIIYNDPWKGNYYPERLQGEPGFMREMTHSEWKDNLKPYLLIFEKE